MPHERFFTDQPLGDRVILQEGEFHHLCHVMRARIGDTVELINGKNQLATASVSTILKRHAELTITSLHEPEQLAPQLILAQGIPRFNRLEYILEKGTELGVTQFWLFPGIFSEKQTFSAHQLKRMEQITISAMKQCGRLDLPSLLFKPPLLEWRTCPGTLFFGDTTSEAPYLWQCHKNEPFDLPGVLVIGPEKGFDLREKSHLRDHLKAQGVKLHANILRTDTAPLVALSLLQVIIY